MIDGTCRFCGCSGEKIILPYTTIPCATIAPSMHDNVRAFRQRAGQPVAARLQSNNTDDVRYGGVHAADLKLALALILEEVRELKQAINDDADETRHEIDLVEVADALGDIDYVVEGMRALLGIDGRPIAREIHRSNMSKFIDGYRDAAGKWRKGPSWDPPDIVACLAKQDTQ